MSTTVLDELVIRLGLDTTPLQANAKTALGTLNQLEGKSAALGKTLAQTSKHSATALSGLRREALGLLGLVSGGRGLGAVLHALNKAPANTRPLARMAKPIEPTPFAQGIKKQTVAPNIFAQASSLPAFYTRPFAPGLAAGTALSPVATSPIGGSRKGGVLGSAALARSPLPLQSTAPHKAAGRAGSHGAVGIALARPVGRAALLPEKPRLGQSQTIFLKHAVTAAPAFSPYSAQRSTQLLHTRVAPPLLTLPRPVVPVPFMGPVQKGGGGLPSPFMGKVLPAPYAQPLGTPRRVRPVRQVAPLRRASALAQARHGGEGSSFTNPLLQKSGLPPQLPHYPAGVGRAAVPLAQLHVLAAPTALALPAPTQPMAGPTTYIGPVTITVPSGNPQAIAQALRNLGAQTNHTLASLATRGTV